jgi:hypothetical protein
MAQNQQLQRSQTGQPAQVPATPEQVETLLALQARTLDLQQEQINVHRIEAENAAKLTDANMQVALAEIGANRDIELDTNVTRREGLKVQTRMHTIRSVVYIVGALIAGAVVLIPILMRDREMTQIVIAALLGFLGGAGGRELLARTGQPKP